MKKIFFILALFLSLLLLQGCENASSKPAKEYNCFVKSTEADIVISEDEACRITVDYMNREKMIYHESVIVKNDNDGEREHTIYYLYDLNNQKSSLIDFEPEKVHFVKIAPNNLLIWNLWSGELVVTKEDGEFINSVDIFETLYGNRIESQAQNKYARWSTDGICCDDNHIYLNGSVFFTDVGIDAFCIFDQELNVVEYREKISGQVLERADGEIIFVPCSDNSMYKYDEDKKELKKEKTTKDDSWRLIGFDQENVPGDYLYERYFLLEPGRNPCFPNDFMGIKNEKAYSIFSYETMGIDRSAIQYIVSDQQGGFLLAMQGNNRKKIELISLQPTDQEMNYSIKNGKKIITVGMADYWLDVDSIASSFNRESDEYYVEVKNYTREYADYNEAITHLNLDIIAGNACDAYFLNNLDIDSYKEKDVLLEISDYFQHRKEAGLEDFTDTFYRLVKDEDGETYFILPCYKLMGISAKEKIDYSDMNDISKQIGENMAFSNSETTELFARLLRFSGNRYIDIENGTSHIQEEDFTSLLQLLKLQNEYNHTMGDQIERYLNGEIYSVDVQILYPQWFFYYEEYLGKNFSASYPGGDDLCIDPMTYVIGVSKTCEDTEAIYQFFDFLYTPVTYKWFFNYEGFPVLESIWQNWNQSLLATEPYYDSEGNYQHPYDMRLGSGDTEFLIEAGSMSQDDFDRMRKRAEQAVFIPPMSDKYIDIILSEAEPFFEGTVSLEDTIKAMDYRVGLAMEE